MAIAIVEKNGLFGKVHDYEPDKFLLRVFWQDDTISFEHTVDLNISTTNKIKDTVICPECYMPLIDLIVWESRSSNVSHNEDGTLYYEPRLNTQEEIYCPMCDSDLHGSIKDLLEGNAIL